VVGNSRRGVLRFLAGVGVGAGMVEVYERLYSIPTLEERFRAEVSYWINEYNMARGRLNQLEQEYNSAKETITNLTNEYNLVREKINQLEEQHNSTLETISSMDRLEKESNQAILHYRERMDEAIKALKNTVEKYRVILGDERVSFESTTFKVLEDLKLSQDKLLKILPYFPLIRNLSWRPSRVVNDKIYDLEVSLEVISPLNTLTEVEVSLIPVEYEYFITRYGMSREDYHKAFPPEETKIIKLKPAGLERETFNVEFKDIIGGREYLIKAVAKDVADSINSEERKTPYIRQFESLGRLLCDKGIIVSAVYEPWNMEGVPMKDDVPLLGRYLPSDDIVQWKHIDWATGYGINVFYVDGGFWEEDKIKGMEGTVISGLMGKGMKCAATWGWLWEAYFKRGSNDVNLPDWVVDLGNEYNKEQFKKVLTPLITAEFLNHYNYHKINGRPVIHFYDAIALINEGKAVEDAKKYIKGNKGIDIFLVGGILPNIPARPNDPHTSYLLSKKDIESYEAFTGWAGFHNRSRQEWVDNYEDLYNQHLAVWYEFTKKEDRSFIPTIIPGFDNSYSWGPPGLPPIERSPEKFMGRLKIASRYLDSPRIIRIDTWNDFGEWSYVEPTQKEAFTYLEKLREVLLAWLNPALNI
jgi:hypothetical protein